MIDVRKAILTVDKNYICSKNDINTNEQLEIVKPLEEVTTGKPPDQDSFLVSPQAVRTPKWSYSSNLGENCLEEMMASGNELENTD